MVILRRKEVKSALIHKINTMSDDELVELYEVACGVTPTIHEVVDEEYIQEEIWNEMRINVTVQVIRDIIEIIPDSYQEFADYWEVDVNSRKFWDKMNELEDKWAKEIGNPIKIKQ